MNVVLVTVPTDRAATAEFAAAATDMVHGAVRLARGARPAGAPHKRARSRAEAVNGGAARGGEFVEGCGGGRRATDVIAWMAAAPKEGAAQSGAFARVDA